jgi:hypothetical protein
MKLPKAFTTSRVTEALESLAMHIIAARDIAASLKPAKISKLELEEEEAPRPIIKSVTPPVVKIPDLRAQFTIKGKNLLNRFEAFDLFLESDPTVVLKGEKLQFALDGLQFTTYVVVGRGTRPGIYEVRVKDTDGNLHLPGFNVEVLPMFNVEVQSEVAPTITTPPLDTDARVGESKTLSVEATGTAPLRYQWLKEGAEIPGAKSKNYAISKVKKTDAGLYTVIVENSAGLAIGRPATVRVSSPGAKAT